MNIVVYFLTGLIFGLGLVISGMADPAKVANFLDLAGAWDPSLAFVMGGALVVTIFGYSMIWRRGAPLFAKTFAQPAQTKIDSRLIAGAAIFGIGWGMAGLCPGPALAILAIGGPNIWIFAAAMALGMASARKLVDQPQARG